jgi:hypothetical protein
LSSSDRMVAAATRLMIALSSAAPARPNGRPVAADQPQPRPVIALPHEDEVGVQHREQLTGRAGGLPSQRDRHRGAAANRVQHAHPYQLGQPGCAADRADADERLQPSLVRGSRTRRAEHPS